MKHQEIVELFYSGTAPQAWRFTELRGGEEIAYLLSDTDLRIEGSSFDNVENENYIEPWANKWSNPSAVSRFFDLFYRNTLINRFTLVSVDGHRCLLPQPESRDGVVLQSTYKVAEIINKSALDEYFPKSGLTLSPVKDIF